MQQKFLFTIDRFSMAVGHAFAWSILILTLGTSYEVFMRYVLNWGQAWTELSSVMIMSWFIFLGAAVGVRENYHLGFDVLLYVLPPGSKRILRTVSDLVVIAFSLGMIYYGIVLMRLQWNEVMPSLGISGSFRYLPLTAGGVLITLFSLERVALRWSGIDVDRDLHDEVDLTDSAAMPADVKEI